MVVFLSRIIALVITILLACILYPISGVFWIMAVIGKIGGVLFEWTNKTIKSLWNDVISPDASGKSKDEMPNMIQQNPDQVFANQANSNQRMPSQQNMNQGFVNQENTNQRIQNQQNMNQGFTNQANPSQIIPNNQDVNKRLVKAQNNDVKK